MHPERKRRRDRIRRLDPAQDFEEIYRRTVLWEFPMEARIGFQLAFYRPMAVPRMAELLASTGHFLRSTTKRSYDSAIVIHEIIANGVDSPRAERMFALMARLHARPEIVQDDMTYVLLSLLLEPTRLIERYGARPLLEVERDAAVLFWRAVGSRMEIDRLPESYHDAQRWFADYERTQTGSSVAAERLTGAIVDALRHRMPGPLRSRAGEIMAVLLDNERVADALVLPEAGWPTRLGTRSVMRARKLVLPHRAPPQNPSFTPGQRGRTFYTQGYRLDEIGPEGLQDKPSNR